jgi:tetratricopeptide (TPR) repeat protein
MKVDSFSGGNSPVRCRVVGTPVSYGLETFKNRRAEVEQILHWLADRATRMITVFGHRGIGKSSLVAKVVETLAGTGSGCSGIVNLSTRTGGPLTIERIFLACAELADPVERRVLLGLWSSRRDPREKLLELFATMSEGTHVIVLDNIEDQLSDDGRSKNADLDLFLDVVFRASRAPRVLVTSQVPVALDPAVRRWEARLHLENGLPVAESVELLRELDRNGDAGLLDAPRAELEQAARRLHGVPRALELTVGVLTEDNLLLPTLDNLLDDFTARGDVVDQLAHDRYRRLDDEARLTLDVLAVFGRPVTGEPVQWVLHPLAPNLDPRRVLSHLAQVHMVSVNRRSRKFALHPLDADIAYGALPVTGPAGRQVLERRVAGWFQRQCLPPPWRTVADVANHRQEYEHLLRAGDYDDAALILGEIGDFLVWQGSIREVLGMHLAIRGHLHDDAAVLSHLVGYGQARHIGGPLAEAIAPLQQGVALAQKIGDRRQLERALFSLGDVFRAQRRLREAVDVLGQAAALAHELGDSLHEAHSLLCLSLSYAYLDEIPAALDVADRLHLLAKETGEATIRARTGDARSAAYIVAGRWSDAFAAAEQAVAAYEDAGVPEALGYARNVQGIALLGLGRVAEAVAVLSRARGEGSRVESPRAEGLCLYNLSWAHWLAGRHADARSTACEAVEAFRRSGGADVEASEELVRAATAMLAGDRQMAGAALRAAASKSRGNCDLAPARWLAAEADLLGEGPS